ncbi:H/ACA ribonucleoprotein complex non-core subunit NAF1 [Rosa chinensis]|uniref:H/ACA ribonucleoprotein complex non-core subunit NAF1 n=1 Tax=Rosa chinensis TaxID=74649 RepID=UPI000D0865F7|nr:H/ACA ribonucleoprotein complex non-core subunit NAF1 [Rosa chinensis]
MVGFTPEVDLDQASKLKLSKDPPDAVDPRPIDLSFVDSLLDFDSIETWFRDFPNPDMAEAGTTTVVKSEPIDCEPGSVVKVKSEVGGGGQIVNGSEPIDCGLGGVVNVKSEVSENLRSSIEEELGKVSLVGGNEESLVLDSGNGVGEDLETKIEGVEGGIESESSESESESSSAASSSSSSSSSDEDEEERESDDMDEEKDGEGNVKAEVEKEGNEEACELEEGEISGAEQIGDGSGDEDDEEGAEVAWSDVDIFDEGDEEEEAIKGPIRSKNELEELPPVPSVNVTLEPHHQMLPVGVVLSVVGTKVIVEGVEKHNPLNEGSILWITESRSPLGLVDEIFGPVINPYYMVRYNTESEIPAGIEVGTPISFVQEFADHVLNNKDLYRKGYDASGANDEEVSDEAEFSDDEKEAEYKRLQKMTKRGMNDQNAGSKKNNRKRGKNKMGPWKNGQSSPQQTPPNQHHEHPSSAAPARRYGPSSSAVSQGLVSGRGSVRPFPGATQATGMNANGVWSNGMPCQPQQTPFPNAFPNNNMPFFPQYPHQMSMPGGIPFHQQTNVFSGPMGSQGMMGQLGFHQPAFGVGFQGQPTPGQQLNSFPGPMNAFGMSQQGQHGFNQNAFGMGQQGFNPNVFGVGQQGQHGFNPNAFAMVQQGQHGFNQNTFGIGSQGQPTNLSLEQNMPQPGNPVVGDTDAPQQFSRSTSANRGRRPFRRGGRQGRGRGSR